MLLMPLFYLFKEDSVIDPAVDRADPYLPVPDADAYPAPPLYMKLLPLQI
jgi:hypothetical protein